MDERYIAERLTKLRMERNVSAREMSLFMGQAGNYINNIENSKSTPSMQNFFAICEYLKVTPKEFFDEGSTNPALLNELIEELKPLNSDALTHFLGLAREMRGKRG